MEDRPREKLIERGADQLTETELLAILLGTGSAGEHQNALDHARMLMMKFGGLGGIDDASVAELTGLKGWVRPRRPASRHAWNSVAAGKTSGAKPASC